MRTKFKLAAAALLLAPTAAWAGPPFLTDDPEPTDTRALSIRVFEASGLSSAIEVDGQSARESNAALTKVRAFTGRRVIAGSDLSLNRETASGDTCRRPVICDDLGAQLEPISNC